jgi:outer membrane protein assembly factor BamB
MLTRKAIRLSGRVVRTALLAAGLVVHVAACGGSTAFGLASEDNSATQLSAALMRQTLPLVPSVRNRTGKAMVFALNATPKGKELIAIDLENRALMWRVAADVQSRIVVSADLVIAKEGDNIAARNISDGELRWRVAQRADLLGIAAAGNAVALVSQASGDKPLWIISALSTTDGASQWQVQSDNEVGAPIIHGDLVLVPFLSQWLNLLDLKTGRPVARLRGLESQISLLHSTSDASFFGSSRGMFRLDDKAASGKRADATYISQAFPAQLQKSTWATDAYSKIESNYTAADRTRILWRTSAVGPIAMSHATVLHFRYLFDYGTDGMMRWAYVHPRTELIAAAHIGTSIVALSATGDVLALDPDSGATRVSFSIATDGGPPMQLVGATIDADGWATTSQAGAARSLSSTLIAIAQDRDARFEPMKELAIVTLAKQKGAEVTSGLLGMLRDERMSLKLKERVVEQLIARKDAQSIQPLTDALAIHTDYVAAKEATAVGALARALTGLRDVMLGDGDRAAATAALVLHLEDPATSYDDLDNVIDALSAVGGGRELAPLKAHLLAYRADPQTAGNETWRLAIVAALLRGGPAEREILKSVSEDIRSEPTLVKTIREQLPK